MIAKDSISLKHIDGKTVKLECLKKSELKPDEIKATGSSLVDINIGAYQNRKIEIFAAPNSSLILCNPGAAPLHAGFIIQWSADATKDTDGKAKLAIKMK